MVTKSVEQVFIEALHKKLDERREQEVAFLLKGAWETEAEGKSRVAVIQTIDSIKIDFNEVYKSCFN